MKMILTRVKGRLDIYLLTILTMNKFKLTKETKQHYWITLYRIEALKDFDNISKWDKWWWVEKEENLSQDNTAWVSWNASVYWGARVYWDARVYW